MYKRAKDATINVLIRVERYLQEQMSSYRYAYALRSGSDLDFLCSFIIQS
jgi:hypothetical protein